MCISNSNATTNAKKSGVNQAALRIAQLSEVSCPLRPTVSATQPRMTAKAWTCLHAIRNHVELDQAGRLLSLNSQRYLRSPREMCGPVPRCWPRKRESPQSISPLACNSSWMISGMSFHAIQCLTVIQWIAFCARELTRASRDAMDRLPQSGSCWSARKEAG